MSSLLFPEDMVRFEDNQARLKILLLLLIGTGLILVLLYLKARSWRSPPADRGTVVQNVLGTWLASAAVCGAFCYSLSRKQWGYDWLFGPPWIWTPVLTTLHLSLPVLLLVMCSFLRDRTYRLLTRLNILVLLYVYGGTFVRGEDPSYFVFVEALPRFHYIGPVSHAATILASFLLVYVGMKVARRMGGARPTTPTSQYDAASPQT